MTNLPNPPPYQQEPPPLPPAGWPQQPPPGRGGQVCPACRSPYYQPVSFTWWGGVLGPKLLHHVKCGACGATFNERTGRSNTNGIIIYTAIGAGLSIVILVLLAMGGIL